MESVDSICRDGADMPISFDKSNGLGLPNADVMSVSYQQPALRVLLYTITLALKVHKIHSYSDSQKIVKRSYLLFSNGLPRNWLYQLENT